MEEHVFGTFSTDRLKFLHERALAMGVQHRARTLPADPLPDEPFTLVVTSGPDVAAREIVACYTTDGSEPTLHSAQLPFQPVRPLWSTPAWGYVTEWHAAVPPQPEGTLLRYRIAARGAGEGWQWAEWPDPKRVVEEALTSGEEAATPALPTGAGSHFALSIDRFAPPPWAQEALIYQLFLDRFARSDDAPWPTELSLMDIHGGTLRGATEKLEYIASLGVTCIWLSPLFPSPTHHGYDATDYFDVEPRLGTKADLKVFIERAHALGMRVLLDFVCNHVCNEHLYFQEAQAAPESERRAWFHFAPALEPLGYRAFFGVESMPELNTDHPPVRDYLLDAATMWVRDFDVDGFRLDYAHGPSHAFWAHFWRALKQIKPEVWCFGEIVDTPESQVSYLGFLDGVLDFQLVDRLRGVFATGRESLVQWERFLHANDQFFPPQDRFSRPAFLDNHDMNRFLYAVGGDERKLRLAALVLYTLPNPPIVYYGTEVALEQRFDKGGWGLEVAREPMRWGLVETRAELLGFFQRLGALRHSEPALRPLARETLHVAPDSYLGRHARGDDEVLLLLNRAEEPLTIEHDALRGTFRDLLGDKLVELEGSVSLAPVAGRLLKREAR